MVTLDTLKHVCPFTSDLILSERLEPLQKVIELADATPPLRAAAMVAQLAFESAWFRTWIERDDGRHFQQYEPPGRIATMLGNTQPGDGSLYCGRGFIQLTGRSNYGLAGLALNLELVKCPSLASIPDNAARIAAWYWTSRELNGFADVGDMVEITKRINGGTNGLAYRLAAYQHAKEALGVP